MTWDHPAMVARFVGTPPNAQLMAVAHELSQGGSRSLTVLDIGCGAGRNAVPLALRGHRVTGIDLSPSMLAAATEVALRQGVQDLCRFLPGEMDELAVGDGAFDLVVAHGIWNLAADDGQFLRSIAEASRVARPGASLFVFTFARVPRTPPEPFGSRFAVPQTDGSSRCYVTERELDTVLGDRGFTRPPGQRLTLYNETPRPASPPAIFEGVWKKTLR